MVTGRGRGIMGFLANAIPPIGRRMVNRRDRFAIDKWPKGKATMAAPMLLLQSGMAKAGAPKT